MPIKSHGILPLSLFLEEGEVPLPHHQTFPLRLSYAFPNPFPTPSPPLSPTPPLPLSFISYPTPFQLPHPLLPPPLLPHLPPPFSTPFPYPFLTSFPCPPPLPLPSLSLYPSHTPSPTIFPIPNNVTISIMSITRAHIILPIEKESNVYNVLVPFEHVGINFIHNCIPCDKAF